MRRASLAVLAALALAVLLGALPARAQSIYGLSFRPTDALPEETSRGTADIVAVEGEYFVSVDLSEAADALDLANFGDAEAFVVWAVAMDGKSTRVGALNDELRLEDTAVGFFIARLYLTAEPSADVDEASGDRLFEVTLRRVTEVASAAADEGDAEEAAEEAEKGEESAQTAKSTESGAAAAAAAGATGATGAVAAPSAEAKPHVLPTTGSDLGDLLVLLAVAGALILAGLRLRAVRV